MSSNTPSTNPKPSNGSNNGKNINPETVVEFAKNHVRETVAYVLLVLGIILLFFDPIYGGALVGIVAGIYFGDHIVNYIAGWKLAPDGQGLSLNLIIAGLAIAFLITSPGIFLGMAIAIGIKQLFVTKG